MKQVQQQNSEVFSQRSEGLERASSSLQAHGKIANMDVFFWFAPLLGELENTLSAFPAPKFWICTPAQYKQMDAANKEVLNSVTHTFVLADSFISGNDSLVTSHKSIIDAFKEMKEKNTGKGIVLITCCKEELETRKVEIEGFLSLY